MAVKEMEVMIINVINAAFDTVTYAEQGIEILDAFMHLNAREVGFTLFPKSHIQILKLQ
jgi:dynein heavy chain